MRCASVDMQEYAMLCSTLRSASDFAPMHVYFAARLFSTSIATIPLKPLRKIPFVLIRVDRTMAFFIVVCPDVAFVQCF